jgi:hypothetical protein
MYQMSKPAAAAAGRPNTRSKSKAVAKAAEEDAKKEIEFVVFGPRNGGVPMRAQPDETLHAVLEAAKGSIYGAANALINRETDEELDLNMTVKQFRDGGWQMINAVAKPPAKNPAAAVPVMGIAR